MKVYGGHVERAYDARAFYAAARRVCGEQEPHPSRTDVALVPKVLLDELTDQVEAGAVGYALGQLGAGRGFTAESQVLLDRKSVV